ncbi:MAG: type 4a pilus biogenesis protein PilO [Pyrinomonadaceae bacterium]
MEKFKKLAWHWQLLALVGVAALLYGLVYYFFTSSTRAETATIDGEVAQLKSKNQAAQIATQRINEFRSQFAAKEEEYDELKVLLPEQREITNILQGLQDAANESALIVNRFTPRDDTQQEFITAKPVEVEVDSNFNNLRNFFEKMAKLPRIVSITDFSLNQLDKQSSTKTLHAKFLLTAFYASPESLNNLTSPPANGAPGAPGAPVPANGAPKPAAPAPSAPAAK